MLALVWGQVVHAAGGSNIVVAASPSFMITQQAPPISNRAALQVAPRQIFFLSRELLRKARRLETRGNRKRITSNNRQVPPFPFAATATASDNTMLSDRLLATYRAQIASAPEPHFRLAQILKKVAPRDYSRLAWALAKTDDKTRLVAFGPDRYDDLKQLLRWEGGLFSLGTDQTLWWLAATIKHHAQVVNNFFSFEAEFNRQTLEGSHLEACKTLDRVDNALGKSLWLLENRIANLELTKGIEAQKNYLTEIRERNDVSAALKSIAYYTSYRSERTVSVERYHEALLRSFPGETADYLIFRLGFFGSRSFLDLESIIIFESRSSIIDRYLTLLRVLQLIYCDERLAKHKQAANQIAAFLSGIFRDTRLDSLLAHSGRPRDAAEPSQEFIALIDDYSLGRYEEVLARDPNQLQPCDRIAGAEVRAKARIRLERPAPVPASEFGLQRIEELLSSALRKGVDCLEAYQSALKMVIVFPSAPWAADLFGCLSREFRQITEDRRGRYTTFGLLNGSPYSPRLFAHSRALPKWAQDRLERGFPSLALLCAVESANHAALLQLKQELPELRYKKYESIVLRKTGRDLEAFSLLLHALRTGSTLDREDATEGLVNSLVESGSPIDAFNSIVLNLTEHPGYRTRIDLVGLWGFAKRTVKSDYRLSASAAVPVLCDMVHRHSPSQVSDGERSAVAEEFLAAANCERPSKLIEATDPTDWLIQVYFLRYIAVPQILDSHLAYESSVEVDNERIAVCQRLIQIDPDNQSVYSTEIAQITQRQLIQRGVREVEKSKIFVDIDGIRRVARLTAKDLFDRYRSLPHTTARDIADVLLQIGSQLEKRGIKLKVSVPRNERLAAFGELVRTLRDRFVSSNEYGLDVYLSVGIRHGTLAGQLRSVFEREGLLARRAVDGTFLLPPKWQQAFEGFDDAWEVGDLPEAIFSFTGGIDSLISDLRDRKIQIQTETRPSEGWFNYRLGNSELLELEEKVQDVDDFESVFDIIIEHLWAKTDNILSLIRGDFGGELRKSFTKLLDDLSSKAAGIPYPGARQQFQAAITRVRPMVQSELSSIAAWFTRHGGGEIDPYAFETAIEIARTMFERCNPLKRLALHVGGTGGNVNLSGRTLAGMVDIIYILLDNVGKYGVEVDSTLSCSLKFEAGSDAISIEMRNEVLPETAEAHAEAVEALEAEVKSKNNNEKAKKEGGTGLHKLAKIVRVDFGSELDICFGYEVRRPNTWFAVQFSAAGGRLFK